jgi:hypothetical protein
MRGLILPRLTVIHFSIPVYCGNYVRGKLRTKSASSRVRPVRSHAFTVAGVSVRYTVYSPGCVNGESTGVMLLQPRHDVMISALAKIDAATCAMLT